MKKYYLLLITFVCIFWACDDKLDIVPKGKTTLSKLSDIELLLNNELDAGCSPSDDLGLVCNDAFPAWSSVPSIMSTPNSVANAHLVLDETINRADLLTDDYRYTSLYKIINYMNVVVDKAIVAEGDELTKQRLIAEAKVVRAYFHYLLVNIYARQYDEGKASSLGGIPYVTSTDVSEVKEKLSVAAVYEKILEDCSDDVITCLNDYVADVCRVDKAFGNAVKAKTLFQMKRYQESQSYARKALNYNNNLEDRSTVKTMGYWMIQNNSANNYLYVIGGGRSCPTFWAMPAESAKFFDPDDYVYKYEKSWNGQPTWNADRAISFSGLEGGLLYTSFDPMWNPMGIRTENMYFIIAETLIREGKIRDGLDFLDRVRIRRIENPVKWTDLYDSKPMTEAEAMELVRQFSYIEFFAGYDTFFNCKRWNSEPAYSRTITKDLGQYGTYSVSPDSPLWVMPFPQSATRYNATLTQNY